MRKTVILVAQELTHPDGLSVARLRIGDGELAVLSFPGSGPRLLVALSVAERDVALMIVDGKSNAEIAASRRTSVRTVANQVASVFRKCGVCSRAELAAALMAQDLPEYRTSICK
jgi:DNA-binding CsgD family transcriptional regulator